MLIKTRTKNHKNKFAGVLKFCQVLMESVCFSCFIKMLAGNAPPKPPSEYLMWKRRPLRFKERLPTALAESAPGSVALAPLPYCPRRVVQVPSNLEPSLRSAPWGPWVAVGVCMVNIGASPQRRPSVARRQIASGGQQWWMVCG